VRFLSGDSRRPLRFILVGGWNTAFGYASFAAFYWVTTRLHVHYMWAVLPAQIINILNAFVLQRWFVFRAQGPVLASLIRFSAVYWIFFGINLPILPLLVQVAGLHPLVAQAILVVVNAAVSYAVHSKFTFRAAVPPQP
jgi:putative flippase GtrA